MELGFFQTIEEKDAFLFRIDGRVKTVFLLVCVVLAALVQSIVAAAILWAFAVVLYGTLKMPWRPLVLRLIMPFSIAWLVFLSVIFTHGQTVWFVLLRHPFTLIAYQEGFGLGLLMMTRIMAAVSLAALLAFSTPMTEILETLRELHLPRMMIDIAELMARYLALLEDTSSRMHRAQHSRTVRRLTWLEQIQNAGAIAGRVLLESFERGMRVYGAMASRGYREDQKPVPYYTERVSALSLQKCAALAIVPVVSLVLNFLL
ncbi:MAG TPA: cobalt ECF transporter T component CbiQ [Ruminococcaceae bacterium]|nr:cobalt ECF transporter T component CbiQ [Oscillospiraceae bacterium]